jgi:hypothetical protein
MNDVDGLISYPVAQDQLQTPGGEVTCVAPLAVRVIAQYRRLTSIVRQ